MLTIAKNIPKDSDDTIDSKQFRIILDTNLPYILNHVSSTRIPIVSQVENKYSGDFYGLLKEINIDKKLHWLTMRCNNLVSTHDYVPFINTLILPDISLVNALQSRHKNISTIR